MHISINSPRWYLPKDLAIQPCIKLSDALALSIKGELKYNEVYFYIDPKEMEIILSSTKYESNFDIYLGRNLSDIFDQTFIDNRYIYFYNDGQKIDVLPGDITQFWILSMDLLIGECGDSDDLFFTNKLDTLLTRKELNDE